MAEGGVSDIEISAMVGKTPTRIEGGVGGHEVTFHCLDGWKFQFYFEDEDTGNAASIRLEDLGGGSLDSLLGHELVAAEMVSDDAPEYEGNHATWTFVKLRSHGGDVTMRWWGSSNGYYAEGPMLRGWKE